MGDVGSARYEPALLPPCPSIRVLSYSNCHRSTHSMSKSVCNKFSTLRVNSSSLELFCLLAHTPRPLTEASTSRWLAKLLMAEWFEQACQWHEVYCHDLEVMSSNPSLVKLWVRSTSVLSLTWTKNKEQTRYKHWEDEWDKMIGNKSTQ